MHPRPALDSIGHKPQRGLLFSAVVGADARVRTKITPTETKAIERARIYSCFAFNSPYKQIFSLWERWHCQKIPRHLNEKSPPVWPKGKCVFVFTQMPLVRRICYAQDLRPLGKFATDEALGEYPPIKAGDMMQEELKAINLAA